MKRSVLAGLTAIALLLLPSIAAAAVAYTVGPTNVRNGPGMQYRVVALLTGGTRVEVVGCVKGYSWCKLGYRGGVWIASSRLHIDYRGRRVPLGPQYYRSFGAPIIVFNF